MNTRKCSWPVESHCFSEYHIYLLKIITEVYLLIHSKGKGMDFSKTVLQNEISTARLEVWYRVFLQRTE